MRKINKEMLLKNVMEVREEEERKRKAKEQAVYEQNLLEIKDFLEEIQNQMEVASKKGYVYYDFTLGNTKTYYFDTIKRFFEELGFTVDVKIRPIVLNYWGIESYTDFLYSIRVSWDKEE